MKHITILSLAEMPVGAFTDYDHAARIILESPSELCFGLVTLPIDQIDGMLAVVLSLGAERSDAPSEGGGALPC